MRQLNVLKVRTHKTYIGFGSNLGNRTRFIRNALGILRKQEGVHIQRVSSWFETDPVGVVPQRRYLNGVFEMATEYAPDKLLTLLKGIEYQLGRREGSRNGPRTIDLDILLYDDYVVNQPDLVIPHPRLVDRSFVLVPLAQIAEEAIHPIQECSIRVLLDRLKDFTVCKRWNSVSLGVEICRLQEADQSVGERLLLNDEL